MKVIFRMIFMCLMSVGVMGSLMACGNAENNDTNKEKTLSAEDKINVGDYLFNADKMETVEISGEDIYRKKKAELSTEIITGKKEIIMAGGNKKDILELRVYQLNPDLDIFKNEPEKMLEINDGYKSYVNEKDEICVIVSAYSVPKLKGY